MPVEGFVIKGSSEPVHVDDTERVNDELVTAYDEVAARSGKILFEGIKPAVLFTGGNEPYYRQDTYIVVDFPDVKPEQ